MEITEHTTDIAIITYGNYQGLGRTIDSVLSQTKTIGTVMLSDDGSGKPFPKEALRRLQGGSFRLILRQREKNLGTVRHINVVAAEMTGFYLKIMASGDAFVDGQALGALVDCAEREKSVVVTSDCMVCSADLKTNYYRFPGPRRGRCFRLDGSDLFASLAKANVVSAAGTLFRRDFFTERGGLDEDYCLLDDWPAWLRLAREGDRIPYLPQVTVLYAMGGVSSANSNAYRATELRADMRFCYEKEILPYMNSFPLSVRRAVEYHYALLTEAEERKLWRTYPLLSAKDAMKRWIKRRMVRR